MSDEYISPSTRGQAFLGILPFLVFGLVSMIGKVDSIHNTPWMYADLAFYALSLLGLLIGWIRGFPLWSYSYLGWSLVFAWWWTNMRAYGIDWGFRIWIPFGIIVLAAFLWTRSFTPLKKLLQDCWHDWTRLTLATYTFGAFMALIYDESHSPYLIPLMAATTIIIIFGVWFFLRSSNLPVRVLFIVVSFIASIVPGVTSSLTWDWRAFYGLPKADYWYDYLDVYPTLVIFWLLFLFWPAIIVLVQKVMNRRAI